MNMHSMPSADHLDEVVVVPLVLLVLAPVQVEHHQAEQEKADDGDVDDVVYAGFVLQQSLEIPLALRLSSDHQLAVGNDRRPCFNCSSAGIPHCQILNVVISSAQSARHEGEVQCSKIPLWFLAEKCDGFISVEIGDSPLYGDSDGRVDLMGVEVVVGGGQDRQYLDEKRVVDDVVENGSAHEGRPAAFGWNAIDHH